MKGGGWGMGCYYFCRINFLKEYKWLIFLKDNCIVTEKRGGIFSYVCRPNLQIYCSGFEPISYRAEIKK